MAYSYVTRSGDGSNKSFTFSFEGQDEGYIRDEDIHVEVDGTSVPFTLITSNTLETNFPPPEGEGNVLIRRKMPRDLPYADFKRGNNFGQEVLNNSFLQLLYLFQEILDGFYPQGTTFREDIEFLKGLTTYELLDILGRATIENSDPEVPKSVVNFLEADKRYKEPLESNVSRLDDRDAEITENYQNADASLQRQISGEDPLVSSAFSPISWHDQSIENSLVIPENKNAWSFGPIMTVASGQTITIKEGSYWTIAEGNGTSVEYNIDQGEL